MKITDVNYYITKGLFYGYGKESVLAFLLRQYDVSMHRVTPDTPSSIGTPFEGYGWIPSHRELLMRPKLVIEEINSRRIYTVPFPQSISSNVKDEKMQYSQYVFSLLEGVRSNRPFEEYLAYCLEGLDRSRIPVDMHLEYA